MAWGNFPATENTAVVIDSNIELHEDNVFTSFFIIFRYIYT